ncbi:MAG: AI-2E family transporter [Verrucomicrobia bacterium]|nr:AI-2E family transporter [Verrucomicrobiota bacterium]
MDRQKIVVALLSVLALVAVCAVLKAAQSVVLPLIIAWLLSYILGPVVTAMTRRRIPTGLAVTLVLLLLLGICYLGGLFLHARVMSFYAAYPQYQDRVMALFKTFTSRWDLPYDPLEGINWGPWLGERLKSTAGSLLSFTSKLIMVIIYLVFLLLGKPYFKYKLQKAFLEERASQLSAIIGSISTEIGRYLFLQLLISLVTGGCVWIALSALGVDFAITWAALAFFLNFIPTVGSLIASIPPILVALVQVEGSIQLGVMTAIALFSIQMAIGNGVTPKVMGERLNLSPVVVLISLVFWGWLWGIVGALLSVPIASTIKIVCENIEGLKPISTLMGSGKRFRKEALVQARSGSA